MGFRRSTPTTVTTTVQAPDPWFRLHPAVAVWVALAMFVLVTALRFSVAGKEDPIS
jgi:hypothetical protein